MIALRLAIHWLFGISLVQIAQASPSDANFRLSMTEEVPYAACFKASALRYRVDPFLLAAIAWQESSFDATAVHINHDRSEDLGVMQINSRWLTELKNHGISRAVLLREPCLNIEVGAWVLATNFYSKGITWDSVGAYNAGMRTTFTQALKRYRYAQLIYDKYLSLRRHKAIEIVEVVASRNTVLDKYDELIAQSF
jgi:soluble lytic murein transglycosylase-like protein